MSVRNEPRGRRSPVDEEFELEEQDVDVRKYWGRIVRFWWLPAAGLLIGALLGLLLASGGKQVYKAEATISLGTPFTPNGTAPVPGLATTPAFVTQNVHAEDVIKRVAIRSGMKEGQVRNGVSTSSTAPRKGTTGAATLYTISVKGSNADKVGRAANAMAKITMARAGVYVQTKIDVLQQQLDSKDQELGTLDKKIGIANQALTASQKNKSNPLDQLVLASIVDNSEQRRAAIEGEQLQFTQLLNLARQIEKPQLVQDAVAVKTTARSKRNSMLAGALLGLLLGTVAALLAEPVAERRRSA